MPAGEGFRFYSGHLFGAGTEANAAGWRTTDTAGGMKIPWADKAAGARSGLTPPAARPEGRFGPILVYDLQSMFFASMPEPG